MTTPQYKTNLFQILDTLGEEFDLTFKVVKKKEDGQLTIFLTNTEMIKDSAGNNLRPLVVKATPVELDENFFTQIREPISKSIDFTSQVKAFEEGVEIAKKSAEMEKEKEEKAKKLMEAGDKLLEKNKTKEALDKFLEAEKLVPKLRGLSKRLKETKANVGEQSSLLDTLPEESTSSQEEPVGPPSEIPPVPPKPWQQNAGTTVPNIAPQAPTSSPTSSAPIQQPSITQQSFVENVDKQTGETFNQAKQSLAFNEPPVPPGQPKTL